MEGLRDALVDAGLADWCEWDLGIVRGLAYYTGTIFEIHETGGRERAIAGGGRYDGLVELMGGPPTSAVGFGMGDVVLGLVLRDRGLLDGIAPPATPTLSLSSRMTLSAVFLPTPDAAVRKAALPLPIIWS